MTQLTFRLKNAAVLLQGFKMFVACTTYKWRVMLNHKTLKEFGYQCTVAEFEELVRDFLPDASSRGRWGISTFQVPSPGPSRAPYDTLEIYLINSTLVLDCMTALGDLLGLSSTLKHVELYQGSRPTPSLEFWQPREEVQSRIRSKLEQMLNNKLGRNTCLRSLCVGLWRLVRVGAGDECEMGYEGPCLAKRKCKEYVVKMMMPDEGRHCYKQVKCHVDIKAHAASSLPVNIRSKI